MVDVLVEFDYDAEQEDELTIKVGDVIRNVQMSEGGWWEGELNGKKRDVSRQLCQGYREEKRRT